MWRCPAVMLIVSLLPRALIPLHIPSCPPCPSTAHPSPPSPDPYPSQAPHPLASLPLPIPRTQPPHRVPQALLASSLPPSPLPGLVQTHIRRHPAGPLRHPPGLRPLQPGMRTLPQHRQPTLGPFRHHHQAPPAAVCCSGLRPTSTVLRSRPLRDSKPTPSPDREPNPTLTLSLIHTEGSKKSVTIGYICDPTLEVQGGTGCT